MSLEANKDEARRALAIARKHEAAGNVDKARRFAAKSLALFDSAEARALIATLDATSSSGSTTSSSTAASASSSARRRTPDAAQTAEETVREYTPEQVRIVEKVRSCAADYYAVLGVGRDASDADIKRAYRKLALQLHPDKNAAPKASEAFKLIANAFTVLSDANKRTTYDRFGVDGLKRHEDTSSHPQHHPNTAFHSFHTNFDSELTPEELFNLFFGGGGVLSPDIVIGPDGRPRLRRRPRRHFRPTQPQHDDNLFTFAQLLPVLVFVLIAFFSYAPREPDFSFSRSPRFNSARKTTNKQVPYYVDERSFQQHFRGASKNKISVFEEKVENGYIASLQESCQTEMHQKQKMYNNAVRYGTIEDRNRVDETRLPSCEKLQAFM